jgi:hypothetical protein
LLLLLPAAAAAALLQRCCQRGRPLLLQTARQHKGIFQRCAAALP